MAEQTTPFASIHNQEGLPTYDEVRYYLISKGVPEETANKYAASDAWKAWAVSNPSGFDEYLDKTAPTLIEGYREEQRARNQQNAAKPKPSAPVPATPAAPAPAPKPAATGVMGAVATGALEGDVDQQVRDNYPGFAWLLDDAEIGPLLRDAVREGWSPERFQARLYGTQWWRTHGEAVRRWDTLRKVDPAEADRQLGGRQAELWDAAFKMTGKKPNPAQIKMLAEYSLRFGLNEAQMRDQLVSVTQIGTGVGGQALTVLNQLRQARDDFVIPIHGQAMYDWTRQVLAGESTVEDFRSWAQEQARSLYGSNQGLMERIMGGQTVRQLASPYMQMAADELGISPDSIQLTDERWIKPLHWTQPNSKEGPRMMSLEEWRRELRSNAVYGWDKTGGARQKAAELATQFAEMFGRR